MARPPASRRLAVVLHDVEPATFSMCALIRDWLDDLGVDRVTLCVVPAPDHHPFLRRCPALAEWLVERQAAGDAIARKGLVSGRPPRSHAAALAARRDVMTVLRWRRAAGRFPVTSPHGAMRVDLRPQDFDRDPDRTIAMERVLRRAAARRRAVTFDDLAAASEAPGTRSDAVA